MQVTGTRIWEWKEEHGMLMVMKSKVSWFILPWIGTPSPWSPNGKNSKAWNPSHSTAAFASCLYWKVPILGWPSSMEPLQAKYVPSHSYGSRQGSRLSLLAFFLFIPQKDFYNNKAFPKLTCFFIQSKQCSCCIVHTIVL